MLKLGLRVCKNWGEEEQTRGCTYARCQLLRWWCPVCNRHLMNIIFKVNMSVGFLV